MGFRGIDPDELEDLSTRLRQDAEQPATVSRSTAPVLIRNGYGTAAESLSVLLGSVSTWGNETAANLTWRAQLIRTGQNSPTSPGALLGAGYATEAPFSFPTIESWQENREHIGQAVADISRWLEQRWNDWDVGNNDLHNIEETLAGLSGDELDEVLSALSPEQLERWIAEMGHSFNGFSQAEKQEVFAMLARNASGEQLGRVHDALLEGGSEADLVDFGRAIRIESPDHVIVQFVESVAAGDLIHAHFSTLAPALAVSGIEGDAAAASAVQMILDVDQAIEIVIVDALTSFDPIVAQADPLASLAAAIDTASDPSIAAAVFARITYEATHPHELRPQLDERCDIDMFTARESLRDNALSMIIDGQATVIDAAADILASNPDGIISELATELDPDAAITTDFLYELIDRGRIDNLGRIARELRGGDAVDPVRFGEMGTTEDYPYSHAQNLAYFAGALTNALEQTADHAQATIEEIGFAAGVAIFFIGAFSKIASLIESAIGATADHAAGDWKGGRVQAEIDESLESVLAVVESAFRPDTDGSGIEVPGAAWENWTETFARIKSLG